MAIAPLEVANTVFVLVDVQAKLLPAIHQRQALLEELLKLLRGVKVLGVPTVWTQQYPQGLGPTVIELASLLEGQPITKTAFSCWGEPAFRQAMEQTGRKQVLLAGIEAHVCVCQTALDLLAGGYQVQVAADAVGSRAPGNKAAALERMASAGATITTTEMALFELLKRAEGPAFKEILQIVR